MKSTNQFLDHITYYHNKLAPFIYIYDKNIYISDYLWIIQYLCKLIVANTFYIYTKEKLDNSPKRLTQTFERPAVHENIVENARFIFYTRICRFHH